MVSEPRCTAPCAWMGAYGGLVIRNGRAATLTSVRDVFVTRTLLVSPSALEGDPAGGGRGEPEAAHPGLAEYGHRHALGRGSMMG